MAQYILGIRPEYEGLRIDPKIPSDLKEFSAIRKFRKAIYNISVVNKGGDKMTCLVNGKPNDGLLPYDGPGKSYEVEVTLE